MTGRSVSGSRSSWPWSARSRVPSPRPRRRQRTCIVCRRSSSAGCWPRGRPSPIRWSSCSTTCITCAARRSPRISASSSSTFPARSRTLLTSRADPRLPVSRWRGRGWLAELRQRDLALTLPETAELFTALGEHRLTASDVERLWRRTEGWVARPAPGRRRAQGSRRRPGRGGRVLRADPGGGRSARRRATAPRPEGAVGVLVADVGRRRRWTRSCATRCRGAATAPRCSGGWRPTCSS